MNFLTKFSLKNSVAVFIITFLISLGGIYSFQSLKIDLLPDIEFPQVAVQVIYPGASTSDIENEIGKKLEKDFSSLEGVKTVQSTTYEGLSFIVLEFPYRSDLDKRVSEINDLIKKENLPQGVSTSVERFSFGSIPVYSLALFSKNGDNLDKIVKEDLKPALENIEGVADVSISGVKVKMVTIQVDKKKANQLGISLFAIKDAIDKSKFASPAGAFIENNTQIPIRIEEKLDTLKKLNELEIKGFMGSVKLKDIAIVKNTNEQTEYARYNLKDAINVQITKKQNANTVEVSDKILSVLKDFNKNITYSIGYEQADSIKKSVESLIKEGLFGALFASLSVLLFLRNIRATIIAIVSIPLSLLITSIFLARLGITLNMMTLGGMAVAVGRVVDDSIVVIENIFRRLSKNTDRKTKEEAIADSTKEILKAITASTITTAVVFLPLGLVTGVTGEIFLPFALTVVIALFASLLVAVTIVPILANFSFKNIKHQEKTGFLEKVYEKVILFSLKKKWIVLTSSLVLLFSSFAMVSGLGFVFLPNEEEKRLYITVEAPASTSLEKTNELSLKIEKFLKKHKSVTEDIASIGSKDYQSGVMRTNKSFYFIRLDGDTNVSTEVKFLTKSLNQVADTYLKGTKVTVQELSSGGPPSNNSVNIDLYSDNLESLQKVASDVEHFLSKQSNVKNVTNNFKDKQKQLLIEIHSDKAKSFGLSSQMVLGTIAEQTRPVTFLLNLDNETQPLLLQYNQTLSSEKEIKDLPFMTSQGVVTLKDFASIKKIDTFSSIQHLNGKIYARISGEIKDKNIQAASVAINEKLDKEIHLPSDVKKMSGGGGDETVEAFKQLGLAMVAAIGLVYVTMLITFGLARIPFIILSSLLFVPIGSFGGLFFANEPISLSSMIGILMLIGIVTTNAIVLIDRVGQNRNQLHLSIRESLIEAGKTRLRPILMTALATVAALMPLAFTSSAGTLISKGLAIVVIGGLTTSTLLTLIVVPVMYELFFYRQSKKENTSLIEIKE